MWNPGFEYVEAKPGTLYGYHRRLCLWSVRYRGTVDHPGLVLGLDRGGSCQGYVYRVDHALTAEVVDYLCDRELLIGSYDPRLVPVNLADGRRVTALTFVSRPDHPHFARRLTVAETVAVVNGARGARGCNRSYVINTVSHMDSMNIRNTELHRIADRLDQPDPNETDSNSGSEQ
jgi:cation transport protein ChaC